MKIITQFLAAIAAVILYVITIVFVLFGRLVLAVVKVATRWKKKCVMVVLGEELYNDIYNDLYDEEQ